MARHRSNGCSRSSSFFFLFSLSFYLSPVLFIGCLSHSTSPIILSVCPVSLAQHLPHSNRSSRSLYQATKIFFLQCVSPFISLLFFLIPSHAYGCQNTMFDGPFSVLLLSFVSISSQFLCFLCTKALHFTLLRQ